MMEFILTECLKILETVVMLSRRTQVYFTLTSLKDFFTLKSSNNFLVVTHLCHVIQDQGSIMYLPISGFKLP